jgi:AcrR family transcriptional regulator
MKSPEKERKILYAAIECFCMTGFTQTTISAIAKKAGVSHATVFLYFENKEELFKSAVIEPQKWYHEQQVTIMQNVKGNPKKKILQIVESQVRYFLEQTNYLRLVQYVFGQKERFPHLIQEIYQYSDQYVNHLERIVLEAQKADMIPSGNTNFMCWSYYAYLNGICLTFNENISEAFIEGLVKNGMKIFGILD